MKEKVLIRISVPMGDKAFDIRVPYDMDCGIVTDVIAEMFNRVDKEIPLGRPAVLWWKKKRIQLEDGRTLREYGITDSEQLLLI